MASSMTTAEATQIGAKTLWIGDVEPWMDENYMAGLFAGVTIKIHFIILLYRLHQYSQ